MNKDRGALVLELSYPNFVGPVFWDILRTIGAMRVSELCHFSSLVAPVVRDLLQVLVKTPRSTRREVLSAGVSPCVCLCQTALQEMSVSQPRVSLGAMVTALLESLPLKQPSMFIQVCINNLLIGCGHRVVEWRCAFVVCENVSPQRDFGGWLIVCNVTLKSCRPVLRFSFERRKRMSHVI